MPPLGHSLFLRCIIRRLLLLGKAKIAKFLFLYVNLHGELSGVFVVIFMQIVGHHLVKALAELPKKEGATVEFLAREAEVRAGRAHVEAAVVAMGVPQALVQELIEGKLGSRKR